MADYYDIEEKSDGSFKVTPRNHIGCGTSIGVVFLIFLIIFFASRCDQSSNTSNTVSESPKPTPTLSESVQNAPTVNNTTAQPSYLAYLHVLGCHSDVTGNNIREESVTDPYGKKYSGPYFALTSTYSMYSGWREAYTELVAGGEYEYLSGTYFADAKYDDYEITFKIYADGILIYESTPITRRSKPVDFKISIKGADIIKVAAVANKVDSTTDAAHIVLVDAAVFN